MDWNRAQAVEKASEASAPEAGAAAAAGTRSGPKPWAKLLSQCSQVRVCGV